MQLVECDKYKNERNDTIGALSPKALAILGSNFVLSKMLSPLFYQKILTLFTENSVGCRLVSDRLTNFIKCKSQDCECVFLLLLYTETANQKWMTFGLELVGNKVKIVLPNICIGGETAILPKAEKKTKLDLNNTK